MITIREMRDNDAGFIAACLCEKGADFAYQAGYGRFHTYPVTAEQIMAVSNIRKGNAKYFIIEDELGLIGSVELDFIDWEKRECSVCRFLIAEEYRSEGKGTEALKALIKYAFEVLHMKRVTLSVFDFNAGAIKCYEKAGFVKFDEQIRDNGWKAIIMEIRR